MRAGVLRLVVFAFSVLMIAAGLPFSAYGNSELTSAAAAVAQSPAQMIAGPHVRSAGSELPMIKGAQDLGMLPPSTPMYITVSFNIRNQGALEELIAEQSTPGSPYYHHYLTLNQFNERFGPTPVLYAETLSYFSAGGLISVQTGSKMTLAFQGTAAQVSRAFGTTINMYHLKNGSLAYANSAPLSLPSVIGSSLASVNGLTSIVKVEPMLVKRPLPSIELPKAIVTPALQSADYETMSAAVNFSSPGYLYTNSTSPPGVTQFMNPSTLTVAYNATPLYRLGDLGQGSTIAIVMAGGYNPSDLSAFAQQVYNNSSQIIDRLTPYPVSGGTTNASYPGGTMLTSIDAFEFTLDIEYSSTMAPRAHIDAVYGPTLSIASLVSAYARLTALSPVPNIITNSWGGYEDTWWNLYGPSWQSGLALENYFMELTSMGSTILAASGDTGGYDTASSLLSPTFPASSPYVVAVGGVRTTVANNSGAAFPSPASFTVNETLAPYGYSEVGSQPVWYPDYPLSGSKVDSAPGEQYWYSGTNRTVDYASGGIGVSYWFSQPWWQHGFSVPDSGRRMIADVAAAADFNETVYFAGAWNFFWGGTSFASPTVAGEFALIDTYLNSTIGNSTGMKSHYLGNALPLLYNLGSDNHLSLKPYRQITSGANYWDEQAAALGRGWPANQSWPANWSQSGPGWNFLSGWGVPDAYNLAVDANALLNTKSATDANSAVLNGSAPQALANNATYTFTLTNQTGQYLPGAQVNLTFEGTGGSITSSEVTTSSLGRFYFDASGKTGYLAIYSTSKYGTAYQAVWIFPSNLSAGKLSIQVLGNTSVMGGFDLFNGFIQPQYPAMEPLMPNTVAVKVMYQRSPLSAAVEVYDATVVAGVGAAPNFSSPPAYPNRYYNSSGPSSPLRSLSYTNELGIAFVETWNVQRPETYFVNATYLGLIATAYINVTPRYSIQSTNALAATFSREFGTQAGYVGNGAQSTIIGPMAIGQVSYLLPVRVTDWRGIPMKGISVDVATVNTAISPFYVQPVNGTQTITNATGIALISINQQLTLDSMQSGVSGLLLIQAFNSSYNAVQTLLTNGNSEIGLPLATNDSLAVLELMKPVYGEAETLMQVGGQMRATSYIGTENTSASFYIKDPVYTGLTNYNNITSIRYRVDRLGYTAVPLPAVGQSSFVWTFGLPSLQLGGHTMFIEFNDSEGFTYTLNFTFYVIGKGANPPPAVAFTSPSDGAYVTGKTTVDFSTQESGYLLSETLTLGQITYNALGLDNITFNASSFSYGPLKIELRATNFNGMTSTASTMLHITPQQIPTAAITSPSDFAVLGGAANLTVGLSYSGSYITGELLAVSGPVSDKTYNTTGSNSIILAGLSRGVYTLTYTVYSADGHQATSSILFTVLSTAAIPRSQGSTYISYLAYALIGLTLVAGVAAGILIDKFLTRKRL